MDYGKTVNLPRTTFPMKGNLPSKEPLIIDFWEKLKRQPISSEKKRQPAGKFILHDGPPYANGHIHIGTALNKILKDIVVRYFSISGYETPFTPGWDCHGLPIEQNVIKEMSSGDENKVGITNPVEFRRKAAEYARKFVRIQKDEFRRLGVSADWDKPYLTLEPYYEASIVEVFGRLVSKGMIYRRKKPVYWCPSCRTALADAEVEYADHTSDDIFVKFRLDDTRGILSELKNSDGAVYYAVIWTTTPWTLPANVALAFHPTEKYAFLKINDPRFSGNDIWIVASKLKDAFLSKNKISSHTTVAEFEGSRFEGMVFSNPLNGKPSVGVLADFVSMEDGSGIVHIAPGHGAEDYQVGLRYNLPVLSPVDASGAFTDEAGEFKGHKVFAANHLIVEKLSAAGALVGSGKITHSYPHCWRCKRAIIFRATEQWFLDVNSGDFKSRLLDAIEKVRWIPAYGKNRISAMAAERPDWCLSRQRLWGTPIPVFYCASCGEAVLPDEKLTKGISELFLKNNGSDIWFEKTPSEILELLGRSDLSCPKCSSGNFKKETDIFDVWFDSGVSSFAVLESGEFPSLAAPADLYLEGSDQHRGWFQTSLIPSVALRGTAPYRTVLTHGFVVDGEGKKMSKSLGNVVSPDDVIKNYGADILRLWVAASDFSEDIRLSKDILVGLTEVYRKIRNTLRYTLGNISDMPPSERIGDVSRRRAIDRYIWTRLVVTARLVESAYRDFEFHKVIYHLNNFCVNDLSSFYFDVLKDCLYTFKKDSFERRSAQSTLEDIFLMLEKYISPVLPFTAEEAWQSYKNDRADFLKSESASVFDRDFAGENFSPILDKPFDGTTLKEIEEWEKILEVRRLVNAEIERFRASGSVGSSLECKVSISTSDRLCLDVCKKYLADLPSVFIVSSVELDEKHDTEGKAAAASVSKADGNKCPRCWNWRKDVGDNPEHLEVCRRCYEAISVTKSS